MSYAENAEKYQRDMLLKKAEIDVYKKAHKKDNPKAVRNALIPMERELVELERKISDDYYAMYKQGIDTYEKRNWIHSIMKEDIATFVEDLSTMREDYIEWHTNMMEQKYPEPLKYSEKVEKVKELANYKFRLFHNTREMLQWQTRQIRYCKCMNQDEVRKAEENQAKLRQDYADDFNDYFDFTIIAMNQVGIKEAKRLLEVRRDLITQGQDDYRKDGKGLITKKPERLQAICSKSNRITSYKNGINAEIKTYTFLIEQDKELEKVEKEYHESGKAVEDERKVEQEETARYDPDWVIPDEEYKDEEGNIIRAKDDDDGRDI